MNRPPCLSERRARCGTLIALLLSGCLSLAPEYKRPATPVPKNLPSYGQDDTVANSMSARQLPINAFVQDSRLRSVIILALANSRSLRATVAAMESARAIYGGRKAGLFPTIDAEIGGSYAHNLNFFSGGTYNQRQIRAGFGLTSFELDLFGRNRSLAQADLERYLASEHTVLAARISLVAETAQAWLTVAMDRSLMALAERTVQSARRTVDVVSERHNTGVASQLDVTQASTTLHQARADVARLKTIVAQDENALNLLVGRTVDPGLLPDALPESGNYFAPVPAGLSSHALLSRPDILRAEHLLRAEHANIGAARAAFFPTLSLTANGGLASRSLLGIVNGNSVGVYSIAPALSVPIFDAGKNIENLELAKANRRQALANYQLAIQTAFREVADALARRATVQEELTAQQDLSNTATQGFELAEKRYRGGIDTYLSTLDAQRTAYAAEQALIRARGMAMASRITTYRVLGGGMVLSQIEQAPTPVLR